MGDNTRLLEKRDELKHEITTGMAKALPALILDTTGRIVRMLTRSRQPVSWHYSAVVLTLVILLPGSLISALVHEAEEWMRLGPLFALAIEMALFGGIILAHIMLGNVLANIRDHLIDAIESADDLTDLQQWLADVRSVRKCLAAMVVFGVFYGIVATIICSLLCREFIGFGLATECFIFGIILGEVLYYMLWMLRLPSRLSRYQYRLYEVDPVNSEVISHLSRMLNSYVYVVAAYCALATLPAASFRIVVWFAAAMIFIGWIPVTIQFTSNQIALSRIVTTAKWKTLNELQAKIRKLRTEANLADKETMEAINRLMDYHDRIRVTRNSTLDLRTGLNFLNQLMLPLFAFLLANIDRLFELVH